MSSVERSSLGRRRLVEIRSSDAIEEHRRDLCTPAHGAFLVPSEDTSGHRAFQLLAQSLGGRAGGSRGTPIKIRDALRVELPVVIVHELAGNRPVRRPAIRVLDRKDAKGGLVRAVDGAVWRRRARDDDWL